MLIVLTIALVLASVHILFAKKTVESIYLFGICLSLMLQIMGVMVFIAKKGGISNEVMRFLFISKDLQNRIRYMYLTFSQMGYIIALGRTLYPLFLLKFAFCYSMIDWLKKNTLIKKAVYLIPLSNLLIYEPHIYRIITNGNIGLAKLILYSSKVWISAYLLAALGLLIYEYFSITMQFCRRQFSHIMVSMAALTGIYYLYHHQDPGQVYLFYDYTFSWSRDIGYMQIKPSLWSYWTLVIISIVCCILGFYSLLNFTAGSYIVDKENLVMQRRFDTARVGASMFVHGMKNQLLAGRIIFKRLHNLYGRQDTDWDKVRQYIAALEEINNSMYERIEDLHKTIRQNSIYMTPVGLREIAEISVERFHKKYPGIEVKQEFRTESNVLVDKTHFCEALSSLLVNAYEAVLCAGRQNRCEISLICHNERLYTVIEIRDNGIGIKEEELKKLFEPFYSSKNSKTNWGMGLHYVKETVKSHYGMVRVESREGVGSSFFVLLPRYG
ncbi:MAG: HAMP domain-containing sensor histidine kinase [Johnsonella sp.]|nr:HAMP domain-containing sensor histidine kinase [Johnsonella sp.]